MKARKLGELHNKTVFEFPVQLTFGEHAATYQMNHYPKRVIKIIAHTARDAGYFACDMFPTTPCLEVEVFGPRGGIAWRTYRGWMLAIGNQMSQNYLSRKQTTFAI